MGTYHVLLGLTLQRYGDAVLQAHWSLCHHLLRCLCCTLLGRRQGREFWRILLESGGVLRFGSDLGFRRPAFDVYVLNRTRCQWSLLLFQNVIHIAPLFPCRSGSWQWSHVFSISYSSIGLLGLLLKLLPLHPFLDFPAIEILDLKAMSASYTEELWRTIYHDMRLGLHCCRNCLPVGSKMAHQVVEVLLLWNRPVA